MNVLVLNCGSSSAKFAVIDAASSRELLSGIAQRLGTPQASLDWKRDGQKSSRAIPGAGHGVALRGVVDLLRELLGCARGGAFIEQAGDKVRQPGLISRILRGTGFDQRMHFNDRQEMLFQHEDGHAVGSHDFCGDNICCDGPTVE